MLGVGFEVIGLRGFNYHLTPKQPTANVQQDFSKLV